MAGPQADRPITPPPIVRRARLVLYVLLLASAAATLLGEPALEQAVREGRAPRASLVVAPGLLAAFIALFAAYRYALVRAGRYHVGKAFVQIGLMVLVLTLVLPGSLDRWRAAGTVRAIDLSRHLGAADAEARAMAAELARHRERRDALRYVPRLAQLLEDPSPEVRRQARASLVAIAGKDAGGEGQDAPERWRAFFRAQGVEMPP
jgi:hypothetical protein